MLRTGTEVLMITIEVLRISTEVPSAVVGAVMGHLTTMTTMMNSKKSQKPKLITLKLWIETEKPRNNGH